MSEVANSEESLSPTQQRTKELFRQSFRFSQDSNGAQLIIDTWLANQGYLEGLDIPQEPPSYILALKPPQRHTTRSDAIIESTIHNSWDLLYLAKQSGKLTEGEMASDLDTLLLYMTMSDTAFQNKPREGRPPATEAVEPDSPNDAHASYVRRFILGKAPTGSDAFDRLLHQELSPRLTAVTADPTNVVAIKLQELGKAWQANHRGIPFTPTPAK